MGAGHHGLRTAIAILNFICNQLYLDQVVRLRHAWISIWYARTNIAIHEYIKINWQKIIEVKIT